MRTRAILICGSCFVLACSNSRTITPGDGGADGSLAADSQPAPDQGPAADGAISCTSNLDCKSNSDQSKSGYCHFESGCGDTGPGVCKPLPEACTGDCPGVCGCDGQFYCNACGAHAAGVSVDDDGDCAVVGSCDSNADCDPDDEYCQIEGGCTGPGACEPLPENCSTMYAPVCGCDGVDYANACMAQAARTNVLYEGECGTAVPCSSDAECALGKQWCVGGQCVECDNSGLACDLACFEGWDMYVRNGCAPCACAPINECIEDADCGDGNACYAGAFCWDWCPPGDPSCCQGNVCSTAGCAGSPPVGCWVRGCPVGQSCVDEGCASSGCDCSDGGEWACDDDCGGGVCQ